MAVKKTVKRKQAKATPKKASAKRITKKAAPRATGAITEKLRKSDIYAMIAESTELSKKQISGVFDAFHNLIERSLAKRGVGEFTLPTLCKIKVINKPATKARKGISPFTGEQMTFKAKPARNVVKIRPLKKLKEMVV